MATIRELLEARLARVAERHGPDNESAKDLKAQIASLGTVRHPSQLAALSSKKNDKYHGAVLNKEPSSAQDELKAAASLQERVDSAIAEWDKADGLTSQESISPKSSDRT